VICVQLLASSVKRQFIGYLVGLSRSDEVVVGVRRF
jgi:hypothetical protein